MYTNVNVIVLLEVLCCNASYTACLSVGENSMEIKTEADSNDITECTHDDHTYAAMSGVSDAIFSTFICLCMTCMMTSQVLLVCYV